MKKETTIPFRATKEFREHLELRAKKHHLKLGTYIRVALMRLTGYKGE
jgi:hypothetical protein